MKLIRIATYCFLGLAAVFPALFLAAFLRNVIEYPGHFEATPLAETLFANSPWVLALILAARLPKAPATAKMMLVGSLIVLALLPAMFLLQRPSFGPCGVEDVLETLVLVAILQFAAVTITAVVAYRLARKPAKK